MLRPEDYIWSQFTLWLRSANKPTNPWNTTTEELKNRNRINADKQVVKEGRSYQTHLIYSLTQAVQLIIYKKSDIQTHWAIQFGVVIQRNISPRK